MPARSDVVIRTNRRQTMVKLHLIIEGGTYDNASVDTANNVEALRQSLHKFFTKVLCREDIQVSIYMGSGYRNAAKKFITAPTPIYFFVDSDCPPDELCNWFNKLKNDFHPEKSIIIPDKQKQNIFFMIQEMEAWFLKQPECIEKWAEKEGLTHIHEQKIKNIGILKNQNIEKINKPSQKLAALLKSVFTKKNKPVKYGKLRTAPTLLDSIDVGKLIRYDAELRRFIDIINIDFR